MRADDAGKLCTGVPEGLDAGIASWLKTGQALWEAKGNRTGSKRASLKAEFVVWSHLRVSRRFSRACANGGLVARTGGPVEGHRGRFFDA
jgi:hypothetical protein